MTACVAVPVLPRRYGGRRKINALKWRRWSTRLDSEASAIR
jgi:hypothetical protein